MHIYFKAAMLMVPFLATACTIPPDLWREVINEGDVPVVLSSKPTLNRTPLTAKLECYGDRLAAHGRGNTSIAVGNIRDYTGKASDLEGLLITQGGALMAYTALGNMTPGLTIYERFDTSVADAELNYLSKRQLGDGRMHDAPDAQGGNAEPVPWKPYYGGSVLQSDYYIVGGITEVNYNIQSGGAELFVDQIGGKGRIFTMNVGVDLRIVGTQTLKVYDTVSIQKQVSGYEVGASVFRFFNSDLWDVNAGAKNQEPVQLAVRMAIEESVLELVQSVTGVSEGGCQPSVPLVQADDYVGGKAGTVGKAPAAATEGELGAEGDS
jgi:curli biogenesis system outer membrane secretion channel CsgG